jgi:signal transduction histidine kinase
VIIAAKSSGFAETLVMLLKALKFLRLCWQSRSLNTKLLIPVVGLMLASLAISTLAFLLGTLYTRDQLLARQITSEQERVVGLLSSRSQMVVAAAQILGANADIAQALKAKSEEALQVIDSRAVIIRQRFDLDLIQIYDTTGQAWANLELASLYRVTSLIDEIGDNTTAIRAIDGHLLLLSRIPATGNSGAVIVGIDLEAELGRIAAREQLDAELAIRSGDITVFGNSERQVDLSGPYSEQISRSIELQLGETLATLLLYRQTSDIDQVTNVGLAVVIVCSLLTTLILIFLSNQVIRVITVPIHQLAEMSQAVALHHRFEALQPFDERRSLLEIGRGDEIGQLTQAFNHMLVELKDLYADLESKVSERTQQLSTASEVARAASSSLDMEIVMQTAVGLICQRLDFYFAGVFTLDPTQNAVVLRAAATEAGKPFNRNNYLILPLDQDSHITTAITTRQAIIVQDINSSTHYLPHPLLPATRAEAVFPLQQGEAIIGALNVQSTVVQAFDPETIATFTMLSDQIAIAIQNARLFNQQYEIANRLTEIDHLKSQFLAKVGHELRTPLNAIIGFTKVILKGIDGPTTTDQRIDLKRIHENSLHLLSVINDLLDLSRIEAGQLHLNVETFDLSQEIAEVLRAARQAIGDKSISLEVDLPPDLPGLSGDRLRIRQAIVNLVSNAIKFTQAGKVSVAVSHNAQWTIVSVADTGSGISPENVESLFRPFAQVDETLSRRHDGMGLGLSLTRYIVELHGGKIWAESKPGVGSTFTFILPVRRQAVADSLRQNLSPVL